MTGQYVLGFDAGGTTVRASLADVAGGVIAARSVAADPEGGPAPVRTLLEGLLPSREERAGVRAVCAGITKVSRAGVLASWERELAKWLPSAARRVVPDYAIAFHGAVPGGVGVAVIAGTGSVAYGENAQGVGARVGGRGWEYGDEGSGAWLTAEMVRRTLRACDGMQAASPLTVAVCEALGPHEAGRVGEAARQAAVGSGRGFLTPLALARAQAGDREAIDLFVGAGGWLARLARVTASQLGMIGEAPVPVALVGGMTEAGDLLLRPFAEVLGRNFPNATVVRGDAEPIAGALRLAARLAAETVSESALV